MLLLFVGVLFPHLEVCGKELGAPNITAESAVLYSPVSGEFIYEKSADKKLPMASTTKIMTALLALEYCEEYGDKLVSVSREAAATEGSSMGLEAGDKITVTDLCAGVLLASGNDGANALAEVISDDFQELMNSRGREIGMQNTNFVTPSGLDAEDHYSTARDMAFLAAEAMKNEHFAAIVSSQYMEISYNKGEKTAAFSNHNKLLGYLDGCIGIKTGYTEKAGRCLVSAVKRDGVMLICVTLNAPDDWNDHEKLYDFGFPLMEEYTPLYADFVLPTTGHPVICKIENGDEFPCFFENKVKEIVYLPRFIYASSCKKGDTIGRVDYIINRKIIHSKNIIID